MGRQDHFAERRRLYDEGACDRDIATATGAKENTITIWRCKLNLPPNISPRRLISPESHAQRRTLYDAGMSDREIAAVESRNRTTIKLWRERQGLPSHEHTTVASAALGISFPQLKALCIELLRRGIGAIAIARETGTAVQSLNRWRTAMLREHPELRRAGTAARRAPRHPSGRLYSKMLPERRKQAFLLYAQGRDDRGIAEALGVHPNQIWEWRHALFLPPIGRVWQKHKPRSKPQLGFRPITAFSNPVHAQIMEAIGRNIAPDLADDAASDMWLAIAEGRLSVEDIAGQAGQYRNKVISVYAGQFGPRSLDEQLGDGDGFRLIDIIRDERSASWLEEMGATVW